MLTLQTDFNTLSDSDQAWGLWLDGARFEPIATSIGVKIGDRVVLLELEDFTVEGDLGFGRVDPPAPNDCEMWFVKVDWSTLHRF